MEKGDNIRSKEMVEEKRKMKLYLERKKVGKEKESIGRNKNSDGDIIGIS